MIQTPYLDLFKAFRLLQPKAVQFKGQAKVAHDSQLARKVIAVQGLVSAENYAKIGPKLGLTGTYLYVLCKCPGALVGIQIVCSVGGKQRKLNFSSICKQQKQSGVTLQIPLQRLQEWGFLVFDLRHFLKTQEAFEINEIYLNATILVKGLWTSPHFYSLATFPKQIGTPPRSSISYSYAIVGHASKENHDEQQLLLQKEEVIHKLQLPDQPVVQKKQPKKFKSKQVKRQSSAQQVTGELREEKSRVDLSLFNFSRPENKVLSVGPVQFNTFQLRLIGITGQVSSIVPSPLTIAIGKNLLFKRQILSFTNQIQGLVKRQSTVLVIHSKGQFSFVREGQVIGYFATGLSRVLKADFLNERIFIIGTDQSQRLTLAVIEKDTIVFKKTLTSEQTDILVLTASIFITCGKQQIIVWSELKNRRQLSYKHIMVQLGQHSRQTYFGPLKKLRNCCLVGSSKGNLYMIDFESGQLTAAVKLHQKGISSIQTIEQRNKVITTCQDGMVKIWAQDFSNLWGQFKLQNYIIQLIAAGPEEIFTLQNNKVVGRLDLQQNKFRFITRSHAQSILQAHFLPSGKLVTVASDFTIKLWSIQFKSQRHQLCLQYQFRVLDHACVCSSSSPVSQHLVVCFQSGILRLFDCQQLVLEQQFELQGQQPSSVQFSLDGKLILVMTVSGQLLLFNKSLHFLSTLEVKAERFVFVSDRNAALTVPQQKTLLIYDVLEDSALFQLSLPLRVKQIFFTDDVYLLLDNFSVAVYRIQHQGLSLLLRFMRQLKVGVCKGITIANSALITYGQQILVENHLSMKSLWSLTPVAGFCQSRCNLAIAWSSSSDAQIYIFELNGQAASKALSSISSRRLPSQIPKISELIEQLQQTKPILKASPKKPGTASQTVSQLRLTNSFIPQILPVADYFKTKQIQQKAVVVRASQPQSQNLQALRKNQFFEKQSLLILHKLISPLNETKTQTFPWCKPHFYLHLKMGLVQFQVQEELMSQKVVPFKPISIRRQGNYLTVLQNNQIYLTNLFFKIIKQTAVVSNTCNKLAISSPCANYVIVLGSQLTLQDYNGRLLGRGSPSLDAVWCQGLQFVSITPNQVCFWRINRSLILQYQKPQLPKGQGQSYTALGHLSVGEQSYICVGKSSGGVWVVECRSASIKLSIQGMVHRQVVRLCQQLDYFWIFFENQMVKCFEVAEDLVQTFQHQHQFLLDSLPLAFSESNQNQILVVTLLGTLWLLDPIDHASVKITTLGKNVSKIGSLISDGLQNVVVAEDGCLVHICKQSDLQLKGEFFCPKSQITDLQLLQKQGTLVSGHKDGNIRLYDLIKYEFKGVFSVEGSIQWINQIHGTSNLFMSSTFGRQSRVWIIFVSSQFKVQIQKVYQTGVRIQRGKVDPFDPYNRVAWQTKGISQVWERKDFINKDPVASLRKVHQLQYYLTDSYKPSEDSTLSGLSFLDASRIAISASSSIFIRNYREHVNLRTIKTLSEILSIFTVRNSILVSCVDGVTRLFESEQGIQRSSWEQAGKLTGTTNGIVRATQAGLIFYKFV